MIISRRSFLGSVALGVGLVYASPSLTETSSTTRKYHVSISIDALEHEPDLFDIFIRSGVFAVWIGGYFYGHWYYKPEAIRAWKNKFESVGIPAYVINVPLGHPGDSLGSYSGDVPLTPPTQWKPGVSSDMKMYAGTSLHPPATEENAKALEVLSTNGIKKVFLDDDFRLARSPGMIGGCFCNEHKEAFLNKYGYKNSDWETLIDSVQKRNLTGILREWIEFTCDELTTCFHTLEKRAPEIELGIMVMYMGSEKAGIRLKDYQGRLFRVGELMFDDNSFGSVKGKCNELFSALFHRRFTEPKKTFSETTAFPADKLSAKNMCAKLVISTIADVRNTMFMSGIQHFPITHWDVLPDEMKKQARFHEVIAGHKPVGPLKHYWGEKSRYVSDDNPYSLFLSLGIPFEVVEEPTHEGWMFINDYDMNNLPQKECVYISRVKKDNCLEIPEDLNTLFKFKQSILPQIKHIPHIIDEKPVVCAWYPTVKKVLIWNLSENREELTLKRDDKTMNFFLSGLESILLDDLSN
ncbi:MAG: hypothetical protein LDL53_08265 [Candidatus Hydrogenedens sp.]|nr:hypothetical protein [Candidatus Hydrogenedens sp.]